jgi:sporulation protein YlmC with PRC-barrel domain
MPRRAAALLPAAAIAVALALPAAVSDALAQPSPVPAPAARADRAQTLPAGQMHVKELLDRDVYTTDNVEIGEVEDVVLDPAQGRIVSVVIEIERHLGLTERHIAVPLDRLRLTPGQRRVTIAMTRDEVRAVPGIRYHD